VDGGREVSHHRNDDAPSLGSPLPPAGDSENDDGGDAGRRPAEPTPRFVSGTPPAVLSPRGGRRRTGTRSGDNFLLPRRRRSMSQQSTAGRVRTSSTNPNRTAVRSLLVRRSVHPFFIAFRSIPSFSAVIAGANLMAVVRRFGRFFLFLLLGKVLKSSRRDPLVDTTYSQCLA